MKIDYLKTFALFKRDARLYLVSSAILLFALFGIYMVLFNLFLVRLGYGPRFVGLINAVGSLVFAVFCLLSGALGKQFGSRRIMIVGLCLCVLGIASAGLAEAIPTDLRSGWLLSANSVGWISIAMFVVNGNPFLMQSTTEKEPLC
jgi:MFS family permease